MYEDWSIPLISITVQKHLFHLKHITPLVRNIPLTKNKPYLIKWRDHFTSPGHYPKDSDDSQEEVTIKSVGFYVRENKYYLYFAQSIYEGHHELLSVLKNNVLDIKELS